MQELVTASDDLFTENGSADTALIKLFMKLTGQTDVTRHECFNHILGHKVRDTQTHTRHTIPTPHTPQRATHVQEPAHTTTRNHSHDSIQDSLSHDPTPSNPTNDTLLLSHTS